MHEVSHEKQNVAVNVARTADYLRAPILSWVATMAVGGLFMGWIGALGSFQYSLGMRLVLWLGLCAVAGLLAFAIEAALVRARLDERGVVFTGVVLTFALALSMTPVVFLVNSIGSAPPLSALSRFLINSLVISMVLVAGRLLVGQAISSSTRAYNDQPAIEAAPILRRLQPGLQNSALLALQSEGHYVRVHTSMGSELVLMRMRDAVDETGAVNGRQTHRSWWVARDAIERVRVTDGKTKLELAKGIVAPVSRRERSALVEARWL
ncbi:MAG: LytTR family DNA-binding domain-containing protein [Pseudomonadota bacterium]